MSNRRRTRPARKDIAIRTQSSGQADEHSDPCDCPACMAEHTAPVFFDMLIGDSDPVGDAIEAECGMAMLLTMGVAAGVDHYEWYDKILADLTGAGTPQAAGMMAALASLSEGQARADALNAIANGPSLPEWARELVEPLTVERCLRLEDRDQDVWALAAEFSRGDARHAFVLVTEPDECRHAIDIVECAPDELPDCLKWVKQTANDQGYRLKEIALDPAAFREEAEAAIDERQAHDSYELLDDYFAGLDEDDEPDADAFGDPPDGDIQGELDLELDGEPDDMPDEDEDLDEDLNYYTVLPVFLARLRHLPEAGEPAAAIITMRAPRVRAPRVRAATGARAAGTPAAGRVMRLRVDIKGSQPPIWRRLEVPADLTLARLHDVLQTSFGWTDAHLHMFETSTGKFGSAGNSLGFTSDARVTLDRVVTRAGDKISYYYDFGDDWHHVIKIEQVMPREPGITYPRCTGGRRAGPPEDCGGIWGFQWLLEILANPAHEEHSERLEWLGLEHASELDPEAFDPDQISKALSARFG